MNSDINQQQQDPDMREEYDFANMKGGVRGRFAERYREGTNLVKLEPEVARAFPSSEAVNEALRLLMDVAEKARKAG